MRVKKALEKLIFLLISILLLSSSNYHDDVDRRLSLWPDIITVEYAPYLYCNGYVSRGIYVR